MFKVHFNPWETHKHCSWLILFILLCLLGMRRICPWFVFLGEASVFGRRFAGFKQIQRGKFEKFFLFVLEWLLWAGEFVKR